MARARGARVIAQTSREDSVGGLLDLADDVVGLVRRRPRDAAPRRTARGIDVVFDPLGGPYSEPAARALGRGGVMVVFGASAGPTFSISSADFYRKIGAHPRLRRARLEHRRAVAKSAQVLQLLAAGELQAVATTELPLEDVNEAHARIVERRAGGKLLLIP